MVGVAPFADRDWVAEQCEIARRPGRPFGVGLLGWSLAGHPGQLDAAVEAGPALVSISFGPYEAHVGRLRDAGIAVATQAGTVEEARAAERAGVDVVVARGAEGGGHGRDEVGTLPLLQAVLDAVGLPVLAAGGISGPRGVAAVLAAGAAGAWVGTAFLACEESETTPAALARLLDVSETGTAYGSVFDVAMGLDWPPGYGGRALRNAFFDRWVGREEELAADPGAVEALRAARRAGDFDTAYIYAGQGVGSLARARPAAEVVAELGGAEDLLRRAAGA